MSRTEESALSELIQVVQLPVIAEQLSRLKETWEQRALDAETMVCEEESLQKIKAFRAETTKEFEALEARRKQVKAAVMEPYKQFEAVYKQCVTDAYTRADSACRQKIAEVESDIKARCEEDLREYFAELCAVRHLDWLAYERAGVKVDMASAKAKTPKRLREQLAEFVARVGDGEDRIRTLEDAEEILLEFRKSLDAADAICAVKERHRRIEEARAFEESRKAIREQEAEAVRRVEALAPPVPKINGVPVSGRYLTEDNEIIFKCAFTVRTTMDKLKKLKDFLEMEGIQYE